MWEVEAAAALSTAVGIGDRAVDRATRQWCEDVFESNRELREEHAKAVALAAIEKRYAPPAPDLVEYKVDDPTAPFIIEEGDLEYVYRKTRAWDDEKEGPDSNEWRILLPLVDAIDAAWATVAQRASKSNGEKSEGSEPAAENATAPT
jgi:cation transport regulator ChaB